MRRTAAAIAALVVTAPILVQTAIGEIAGLRDTLLGAASPYLAQAGRPGWDFGGQPDVTEDGDGYTITAPNLSYRHGEAVAEFGSTVVSVQRQGDAWKVLATPSRLQVRDRAGVALTATAGRAVVEGLWLPERDAFSDLSIDLQQVDGRMRGGHSLVVQQARGLFKSAAAEAAGRTGAFAGDISVSDVRGAAADGSTTRLDKAWLRLNLTDMQRTPLLDLSYRHDRPAGGDGLARELIPTRVTLDGNVAPFPWREALPRLPEVIGRLAVAGGNDAILDALAPLGELLGRSGSKATVTRLSAATPSLSANGSGDVRFQPDGRGVGQLVLEVKGIDDRLNGLSQAERKRSPELFPALALMSMLGDPEGRGRERIQRYRFDLKANGAVTLNGRNSAAIKIPR